MEEERRRFLLTSIIDDYRIPAPDVAGVLSDYQIRRHQLDVVAEEVDRNWEGVCEVRVGVYDRPYFAIHLEPFSKELQRQHWTLGDRIEFIIGNNNCSYFFLPKMEENPYSSEIRVYKRD